MSHSSDNKGPNIKRRELLCAAALPVAAVLAPRVLSAQERPRSSASAMPNAATTCRHRDAQ